MMKGTDKRQSETPHVLIFPLPAQGHVNSMLLLAELLAISDVHVTFLNTHHIHHRLLHFAGDIEARHPALCFKTFPDGVAEDHPRFGGDMNEFFNSVKAQGSLKLRELCSIHSEKPRFTCIIADGMFGDISSDVGDELGIPIILFRTASACSFWHLTVTIFYEGEEDMDRVIKVPGMENLVRCRDLPSQCRRTQDNKFSLDNAVFQTHQTFRAQALIFNTFEDLEGPILSQIRNRFTKLYTLGPLHAHVNHRKACKTTTPLSEEKPSSSLTNSLYEVDRACMRWLDDQPPKSVIYVSFGSIAVITRSQLMEIWYGLVNSKKRFLWVIRPDMVVGKDGEDLPLELVEGTKERGCMVGWAPQLEVLEHVAVGGFMTHSGWNSTLESVVAGVPMICWPYFGDQQMNSRYVSEVWKIGLDMKDTCDRKLVEKMVNDLMVERRDQFQKRTQALADLAKASVSNGGSSYSDFDSLIEYLKSIC